MTQGNFQLFHPELITWRHGSTDAEVVLSDHSRGPMAVTTEEISRSQRTVNGTMRKYIVSVKRTFNVTWEMLPTAAGAVVGESSLGILGAQGIKDFVDARRSHQSCDNDFYMRLYQGWDKRPDATRTQGEIDAVENVRVSVSDFSYDIVKRGGNWNGVHFDFWNVSVTLVEM